jgi:uncharacterized coiled-coil DUF342 family protein
MAREAWTDERLDDLNRRVGDGFTEMREEFRAVRSEMTSEFQAVRAEMKGEFQGVRSEIQGIRGEVQGIRGEVQGVREEIQGVRGEIAAMNRNLNQLTWGLIGTVLVGFLGTIVAIVTQM